MMLTYVTVHGCGKRQLSLFWPAFSPAVAASGDWLGIWISIAADSQGRDGHWRGVEQRIGAASYSATNAKMSSTRALTDEQVCGPPSWAAVGCDGDVGCSRADQEPDTNNNEGTRVCCECRGVK